MKLNNRGWGMREMIIYLCILILALFFVASSIDSLYTQIENSQKEIKEENNNKVIYEDEEEIEEDKSLDIDVDYYYNLENEVKTATMNYINENNYDLSNQILTVTLDTLVNLGYIEKIYDQIDDEVCSAYSNVYSIDEGDFIINSFVSCKNYITQGY